MFKLKVLLFKWSLLTKSRVQLKQKDLDHAFPAGLAAVKKSDNKLLLFKKKMPKCRKV